jgi:outer membrane DcaP-like protein
MIKNRTIATVAALGGLTAAIALLAGLPAAKADELADLRANQELLQQRLDQLAQAAPAVPGGPIGVGSFPRSFLIPGTDTSMRVGGQAVGSVLWYLKGAATGGALNNTGSFNETFTDGQGGTGNLAGIPLKGTAAVNAVGFAPSRSSEWIFSGKQSQIFLDVRQPSAWGEIKAFVSFDFSASNTNTILNGNQGSVNGYIPRLREGYATVGGLLVGQTNGTFKDSDSEPTLLDFGGQTGTYFVSRTPQVRYTYPLGNGWTAAIAAENPNPNFAGPFGQFITDNNQIPAAASCAALTSPAIAATTTGTATIATVPATTVATNITNACLGTAAFFNPSQDLMPTFVARLRLDQPWGHLQWGATSVGYTLNDGRFLNKSYLGYGGAISGHFFTWGKDSIGGGLAGGDGIGDQIANNIGVATNFGGSLAGDTVSAVDSRSKFSIARAAYDAAVLAKTITSFSARIYYEHWWTDQLRSDVDFSMNHNDIPSLVKTVGASGTGALNKELSIVHLNLIWSPVAFVDVGIEGAWGHRVVMSNARGDAYTAQTSMKVRF